MFPLQRGRRLRVNESIRSLVRETSLSPADFMFPMFIAEGENYKFEIPSMPGIFRRSVDLTVEEVKELYAFGSVALGTDTESSDVDLLVELDYEKKIGLEFIRWGIILKDKFNKKVDF
jgi:delta-aminolevulinic acid dehydratase/porphobilinogen synthase